MENNNANKVLTYDETIYSINYEMELLQDKKEKLQKERIMEIMQETAKDIFNENSKEPLSEREIRNLLMGFYIDIRDILKG